MVVAERALAHQAVGDRDAQVVDEAAQLLARPGEQHAAADVEHRALGLGEAGDDRRRRLVVERRAGCNVVVPWSRRANSAGSIGCGEDVHRHVDEHRAGLAVLGEEERLVDDLGEQLGACRPARPA